MSGWRAAFFFGTLALGGVVLETTNMQARWILLPLSSFSQGCGLQQVLRPTVRVGDGGSWGWRWKRSMRRALSRAVDRVEVKARLSGPVGQLLVREGDKVQPRSAFAQVDAPTLNFDVTRGQADFEAALERSSTAPQVAALAGQESALRAQLGTGQSGSGARADTLNKSGAGVALGSKAGPHQVAALEAQIDAIRAQEQDVKNCAQSRSAAAKLASTACRPGLRCRGAVADGGSGAQATDRKGEVVATNQNLFRIGDLTRLWIESRVDESDIGRVRDNMAAAVRLYAFEGKVFPAHVSRILPDADRDRKSFEVDVELDEAVPGFCRA